MHDEVTEDYRDMIYADTVACCSMRMNLFEIVISAADAGKTAQKLLRTGYQRPQTLLKQAHLHSRSR